jgi:hypothetical protein
VPDREEMGITAAQGYNRALANVEASLAVVEVGFPLSPAPRSSHQVVCRVVIDIELDDQR